MSNNYYKELSKYIEQRDLEKANRVVLNELSNLIVTKREDFIYLLKNAGIEVSNDADDLELIDLFIGNIHQNKKLRLGVSMLISHHNRVASFDGELEHSEEGLRATSKVLYNYFDGDQFDFSHVDGEEESSNVAGFGQAIAGAVGGLAKLGGGIVENQRAKKSGATDLFQKKQDSKDAMIQAIMAQRQAQLLADKTKTEQKAKTIKTVLIVSGCVLALAITGGIIYALKK